jgi:hypothetical protein
MKKFRVVLRGENFWMSFDGAAQRLGFYTTRFVEAADQAEAEHRAVDMLRRDAKLHGKVLNDKSDPPLIFAEEIEELDSFDGVESMTPGLAFYEAKPPTE